MEFRILGPLQVVVDEVTIDVGGPKVRALLATLVLRAGQVVSKDRLFEVLWGPEPPASAAATLQSHASHLRDALEPGRQAAGKSVVQAREPGYLLAVDPERSVDAVVFERLAAKGRRALVEEAWSQAAAELEGALALWRGEPLAEFTFEPFAQAEIARLGELRLLALEDRLEADLALGRHDQVAGELRTLVTDQPLRERLWGLLMLALYRSGRQADALRSYAELREVLGEQLGIEPSPALVRLEESMLLQKPELDWVRPPGVERTNLDWDARSAARVEPPAGTSPGAVEAGLAAFQRRAWQEAFDNLSAGDLAGALEPHELEALAEAAFWTGRSGECIALCERIHALHLESGDQRRAAFAALLVSLQHAIRLRTSVAAGWFALAYQLLDGDPECVEQGYLAWVTATILVVLGTSDPAPALDSASKVMDAAERFDDGDLRAVGRTYRGYILVHQGHVDEGLGLLDESMARAAAGALGPLATATVVCRTLSACVGLHDYARAAEWLTAMERCGAEHGLVGFPGDCRMHHAQVLLARGAWTEAERHARRACAEMDDFVREHAGLAFYTVGEVLRLRGHLDGAEEAFGQADDLGRSPQPGLARLLLARGDTAGALAALRQGLATEPWNLLGRARLLAAVVDACVEAGDTVQAAHAAAELTTIANGYASRGLRATADYAEGLVALAQTRFGDAVAALDRSWRHWREVGVTHEAARARFRLGLARCGEGDVAGGNLDLRSARATFGRLGATPDVAEVDQSLVAMTPTDAFLETR